MLSERERGIYDFAPKYYEGEMSNFFFRHRDLWQPVLDSLNAEINKDGDVFNKVRLDPKIIPTVLALRLNGFATDMSCQGHVRRDFVNPAEDKLPYVFIGKWREGPSCELNEFLVRLANQKAEEFRKKGLMLHDGARFNFEEGENMHKIGISKLGYDLQSDLQNLSYSWTRLQEMKGKVFRPEFNLSIYKDSVRLFNLVRDFESEIPGTANMLEVSYSEGFFICLRGSGGTTLPRAQWGMGRFADYLLGRYLSRDKRQSDLKVV